MKIFLVDVSGRRVVLCLVTGEHAPEYRPIDEVAVLRGLAPVGPSITRDNQQVQEQRLGIQLVQLLRGDGLGRGFGRKPPRSPTAAKTRGARPRQGLRPGLPRDLTSERVRERLAINQSGQRRNMDKVTKSSSISSGASWQAADRPRIIARTCDPPTVRPASMLWTDLTNLRARSRAVSLS